MDGEKDSLRKIIRENRVLFLLFGIFVLTMASVVVAYIMTHQPPKPIPAGYIIIR